MARAIPVQRQYPWTLIAAMLLFVCSLALAASTLGIIGSNGGDDQGSGMGGTGKSGTFNDSGFGGTGGPSPFLGDSGDSGEGQEDSRKESREDTDQDGAGGGNESFDPMGNIPGASWMPRETETAEIPEEMQPLIEMQQTPLVDPLRQHNPENGDTLHILDPASDSHLPLYERKQLEMAESGETPVKDGSLEIHLTVPDTDSLPQAEIQRYSLEQLANNSEAPQETTKHPNGAEAADGSGDLVNGASVTDETIPIIDAINLANGEDQSDEREHTREQLPERIQRPELPPMQRVRPAVSRPAAVAPPPKPMRI